MPTPLQKRLGLAEKIWTEEELREQYAAYIKEQAKQYDPESQWKVAGWRMFPNHIGDCRMVIAFETRVDVHSDDLYEIDPKPKPWKIAYRKKLDDPTYAPIGPYSENSFETLDEALNQFVLTAQRIEREFKAAGITEDSPRQGKCASCGSIYDWSEVHGYRGMTTLRPYTQYDDVYDGCRGWD